jgi:hypothetical protein
MNSVQNQAAGGHYFLLLNFPPPTTPNCGIVNFCVEVTAHAMECHGILYGASFKI